MTLRTHWTAPTHQDDRIYVQTPQGRGFIIPIELSTQVARNAIGVVIDPARGAQYFAVDEIRCERREDETMLLEVIANVMIARTSARRSGDRHNRSDGHVKER